MKNYLIKINLLDSIIKCCKYLLRRCIKYILLPRHSLRKKCPYSEWFWSVFFRIRTEYGEILRISPCSVQMRENTDHNNSEYGHFLRSDYEWYILKKKEIYSFHFIPRNVKSVYHGSETIWYIIFGTENVDSWTRE